MSPHRAGEVEEESGGNEMSARQIFGAFLLSLPFFLIFAITCRQMGTWFTLVCFVIAALITIAVWVGVYLLLK